MKTNETIEKVTKTNGVLKVREIPLSLAKDILVKNHYSKKWNSAFGKINFGIFQDENPTCLGVFSLGNMMNPKSYKKISDDINSDNILELNRLWLDDCLGKNAETVFISLCFKYIKKHYKNIKLIQSFADGRLGCGTIYKASNFNYYGYHETLFFEHKDNNNFTLHKVPLENTSRFVPMISNNLLLVKNKLRAFKVKTYRYIYILDKNVNIKLKQENYPPYQIGKFYIDDYKQSLGVLSRVYMGLDIAGNDYNKEKEIVLNYINQHYGNYSINHLKEISSSKYMDKLYSDKKKTQYYLQTKLRDYIIKLDNKVKNKN